MRRREFFRRSGGVLFLPLLGAARTRRATPAPVLNDIFSVEGIPDDPYYLQDDHHSGLDALLYLMGSTGVKFYRTSGTSPLGRPGPLFQIILFAAYVPRVHAGQAQDPVGRVQAHLQGQVGIAVAEQAGPADGQEIFEPGEIFPYGP
jgi:hypothetical protein